MFCPNCGNDCGNAKFCIKCGTKVEQEVKAPPVWTAGLPCPHCGGTKLDDRNCAFCGAQLIFDAPKSEAAPLFDHGVDSYDIPYRRFFPDPFSKYCLSIEKDAVVIEIPKLLSRQKIKIAYRQLTEVNFLFSLESDVRLVFRWKDPSGNDLESTFLAKRKSYGDDLFYHIFYVIKHLAPSHVAFQVKNTSLLSADATPINDDLNIYFESYNPLRLRAADALCHDSKLSHAEAEELIDACFNKRQRDLYGSDSRLAVRDYHRLMRERNREYKEWEKEREEAKARH